METLAEKGQGIKSSSYKTVQRNLRASVPFSEGIKKELVAAMKKKEADEETIKIYHVQGEADLAIRSRARELAASTQLVVVVGNDADYCLGPEIKRLLRPLGHPIHPIRYPHLPGQGGPFASAIPGHMALYAGKVTATLASSPATPHSTFPVSSSPTTSHSTFTPVAWSLSTPQVVSSSESKLTAVAPVSLTLTSEPLPQRPTTPPPRKRDLPFVLFSPSKSQRRGRKSSADFGGPTDEDESHI